MREVFIVFKVEEDKTGALSMPVFSTWNEADEYSRAEFQIRKVYVNEFCPN